MAIQGYLSRTVPKALVRDSSSSFREWVGLFPYPSSNHPARKRAG